MVIRRCIYLFIVLLQLTTVKAQTVAGEVKIRYGGVAPLRIDYPDNAYSYQWYKYGKPISGATTFMYSAREEGDYQVRATNINDCQSDLSDIFRVMMEVSDLEVIKKSETKFVGPNEPYTYTITVENKGNTDNTNVTVRDHLPPNLTFLEIVSFSAGTANHENGLVLWTLPELRFNNRKETLVIRVKSKVAGTAVNTASVKGGDPTLVDLVPYNDFSTDTKKIIGDIKVPNVITPNGDGKNDLFKIDGIELYKENTLAIFNRWGNEVFRSTQGYRNNWNGDGLSEGTYYYVLKLVSKENVESSVTGWITILRDK